MSARPADDQLELGTCGARARHPSYGDGRMRLENLSGPGAIGVAPDPANDWIGVADMANATCSIDGCNKPAKSRGWCSKHYTRWKRHGDPLKVKQIVGDDEARFWSKVDKDGPLPTWAPFLGPCWLWKDRLSGGYGRMHGRVATQAHRFSYELNVGPIPEGLVIDHVCRVRHCVNPAHLEVVTNAENILRGNGFSARHARKTRCSFGHQYDGTNTRIRADGSRSCIACERRRG